MQEGLIVTLAGMGIVFASLGVLMLMMLVLGHFIRSRKEDQGDK